MTWNRTLALASLMLATLCHAATLVNQPPRAGGGVSRWSQLWVDLSGQGNDLDGDSICYADFVFTQTHTIHRLEWWGTGACEQGFDIEFWRQDPNTIAYQPLGVFRGSGAQPESTYSLLVPAVSSDPSGVLRYTVDLPSPTTLPANVGNNPRWFVAIIGRTAQAYATWNWAQNSSGSPHTFQFIRGGNEGGGDKYWVLGDGRAYRLIQLVTLSGTVALGDYLALASSQTLTVELVQSGVVAETQIVALDDAGHFSLQTSLSGAAEVRVKAPHWLGKNMGSFDLSTDAALGSATLINGDIDGDNSVTVFDYGILSDYFDKTNADAGWFSVGPNGFAPADADLDGDDAVTVFDYGILSTSFDMNGE